jgi:ABC-type nickel/cobalt efflux system permease component RcnA
MINAMTGVIQRLFAAMAAAVTIGAVFATVVSAHPGGWAPFFKVDAQFPSQYFILNNKYGDGTSDATIDVPQSQIDRQFTLGESIDFEIDRSLIIVPAGTGPVEFSIDTGDGNTYKSTKISHAYTKPGTYIVKVKASLTLQGVSGPIEAVKINVVPKTGYVLPQPLMKANGDDVAENTSAYYESNRPVHFDATRSKQGSAPITSYIWDYGDTAVGRSASVDHIYDPTYQFSLVILRAIDNNGLFVDTYMFAENQHPSNPESFSALAINPNSGLPDEGSSHAQPTILQQVGTLYKQASTWLRESVGRLNGHGDPLPWYFIILVAIVSMILGGLHALTPGHGKSFMAALLVGKNRSRNRDVFILSSAITITHTAVIYILGIIFLVLDTSLTLSNVLPVFELVSAVIVVGLGMYLLYKGTREWYRSYQHKKAHDHGHLHAHHHHHHDEIKDDSAWGLFLAGASGGLVPCIDALSLLIIAASVHAVAAGLFVVFCFSLGLALTIVAIGMAVIHTKNMLKLEERIGEKIAIIAPLVTGCFIILLGLLLLFGHQV